MVIFLYNLDIFVSKQHSCLANNVFTMDPSNRVIKMLLCICTIISFMFISDTHMQHRYGLDVLLTPMSKSIVRESENYLKHA